LLTGLEVEIAISLPARRNDREFPRDAKWLRTIPDFEDLGQEIILSSFGRGAGQGVVVTKPLPARILLSS